MGLITRNVAAAASTNASVGEGQIRATDPRAAFVEGPVRFTIQPGVPTGDLLFPLIDVHLIGNFGRANLTTNDANGALWRGRLAQADSCTLGLTANGPWDQSSPPGGLTRADIYNDILSRNNQMYLQEYTNVQEISQVSTLNTELRDWLSNTRGFTNDPPGWGGVNDHYARTSNGANFSSFPNQFSTNITDYTITDAQGRRYPERFGDWILEKILSGNFPKGGGPGTVGIYVDVMDHRAKTSSVDWDGDGNAEDAQDDWNVNGTPGFFAAIKWREGFMNYRQRLRDTYPNLNFTGNMTTHTVDAFSTGAQWGIGYYADPDMSVLPYVHSEYFDIVQGGHVENSVTNNGFAHVGLNSAGAQDGGGGSWQVVRNTYAQVMRSTADPKLAFITWRANLDPSQEYNPGPNSVFHSLRWGFATALMDNGYFGIVDGATNFQTISYLDESGLINGGTTGLFPKWLGKEVDPPQTAAVQGSNIWRRRFENGMAIINTDNNNAGAPTVVDMTALGLANQYKRINGSQDSSHNNNATVGSTLSIDQADAYILEKI